MLRNLRKTLQLFKWRISWYSAYFPWKRQNSLKIGQKKEKATSIFSSTVIDEGEEAPMDFNKTIAEEVDAGAMVTKREFLCKRKQVELSELIASRRTRNYGRKDLRAGKIVRFQERTFRVTEHEVE